MKHIVFLVEDDLAIIDVYSMAFKAAGIDFEVISLGKEVIKRIKNIQENKEEKPSLILLDLLLPDVNGTEILKEIRQNNITKDIAVFILSNYTSPETQKTDTIKPDRYIIKTSITPTQLVELVKEQLNKK